MLLPGFLLLKSKFLWGNNMLEDFLPSRLFKMLCSNASTLQCSHGSVHTNELSTWTRMESYKISKMPLQLVRKEN